MLERGDDVGGGHLLAVVEADAFAERDGVATPVVGDRVPLRLVGQLVFFAALTALLLYHGIVPYESR